MDSDYETTYSQDERIDQQLKQQKEEEKNQKASLNLKRQILFANYLKERDLEFFHLKGIEVITFNHLKIKFSFEPAKVASCVNSRIKFYCSIRFDGNHWNIKRNSIPVNYKTRIYTLFYYNLQFTVDDNNIFNKLLSLYKTLVAWAVQHRKFRQEKFQRYLQREDIILDSDDEEIFLDLPARVELHQKIGRVLRRMLPPQEGRRRPEIAGRRKFQ